MLNSTRRLGVMIMAAALGAGMGAVPAFANQARVTQAPAKASKSGNRGLFNDTPTWSGARYGRKGAGICMAQQQRTAVKKRGVARNRKHHR